MGRFFYLRVFIRDLNIPILNSLIFFLEKNGPTEVFDDDSDDDDLEGKADRLARPNCIAQAKGAGVHFFLCMFNEVSGMIMSNLLTR